MQIDRTAYFAAVNWALLKRDFPHTVFGWDPHGDMCFEGRQATVSGTQHLLRLVLPKGFPDVRPYLFVWSPVTLPRYGGGTVNELGSTGRFHTLGNGEGGRVQICHSRTWDCSVTCVQVWLKGTVWLEAYHQHLSTGKPVADFFAPY